MLYLDKKLVEKSKELGFNLSKTFVSHLKQLMIGFSPINSLNNVNSEINNVSWCGRRDLNPGSLAWKRPSQEIDWEDFKNWILKTCRREHGRVMVTQAKKYYQCLFNHDFSEISNLKETMRPNAMKSLSALSKYLGVHEDFKLLVKNYCLKWTGRSADDLIVDRITKVQNPNEIFEWIKQVKQVRPELCLFMDFMAVTGLRHVEAVASYNLIIKLNREGRLNEYYNAESETLEHFRFKKIFFRRSKKAFLSFVSKEMVNRISQKELIASHFAIINSVRKKALKCHFSDIREAHGTLMTKYLKDSEIDFLHGRVTSSIFMKNYFNPSLISDLRVRASNATSDIQQRC